MFPKNSDSPTAAELHDMALGFRQSRYVTELGFAATANMATWKTVFDAVGPFDPSLKSSGDFEWGRRAQASGFAIT